MAMGFRLRCERCTSYRVERRPDPLPHWLIRLLNWSPGVRPPSADVPKPGVYGCKACSHTFNVADVEAYCRAHPTTPDRCIGCDEPRLELVARDAPGTAPGSLERADVYRCAACGRDHRWVTREDPHTLY